MTRHILRQRPLMLAIATVVVALAGFPAVIFGLHSGEAEATSPPAVPESVATVLSWDVSASGDGRR